MWESEQVPCTKIHQRIEAVRYIHYGELCKGAEKSHCVESQGSWWGNSIQVLKSELPGKPRCKSRPRAEVAHAPAGAGGRGAAPPSSPTAPGRAIWRTSSRNILTETLGTRDLDGLHPSPGLMPGMEHSPGGRSLRNK